MSTGAEASTVARKRDMSEPGAWRPCSPIAATTSEGSKLSHDLNGFGNLCEIRFRSMSSSHQVCIPHEVETDVPDLQARGYDSYRPATVQLRLFWCRRRCCRTSSPPWSLTSKGGAGMCQRREERRRATLGVDGRCKGDREIYEGRCTPDSCFDCAGDVERIDNIALPSFPSSQGPGGCGRPADDRQPRRVHGKGPPLH